MHAPDRASPNLRQESPQSEEGDSSSERQQRAGRIRVKNRRKTYLDRNPDYFSASLELADPLLYDRLIRRFQSTSEREAEGRQKGYSGVLEADLMRSEAKLAALAHPETSAVSYHRGAHGDIILEDPQDAPESKEEGWQRWHREMTERFLRGEDADFDYHTVDDDEKWDDRRQEENDEEEKWFTEEEPRWILNDEILDNGDRQEEGEGRFERVTEGETGIQDF